MTLSKIVAVALLSSALAAPAALAQTAGSKANVSPSAHGSANFGTGTAAGTNTNTAAGGVGTTGAGTGAGLGDTGSSNASGSGTNAPAGSGTGSPSSGSLPAEIRTKLQQDGFTNVRVVPGSFLVSAKDKNGDPVTMVIGPNSMMMLTQVPDSGRNTSGSAASSGGNSGPK